MKLFALTICAVMLGSLVETKPSFRERNSSHLIVKSTERQIVSNLMLTFQLFWAVAKRTIPASVDAESPEPTWPSPASAILPAKRTTTAAPILLPLATLARDDAQPDTTTSGHASAMLTALPSTIAARTSQISAEALVKLSWVFFFYCYYYFKMKEIYTFICWQAAEP